LGVVPAPLVFFWTLVGAAVGALIAALVARNQFVGVRREHRTQLKRRDQAFEQLKKELDEDRADFVQRSDDYLRQLAALKRERSSLSTELEETRRTLSTLQNDLETLRVSARETETRLSAALDAAREEAAEWRANAERQESLRSILATLREQYSLASTERDTLARELAAERARADAAEAALQRSREEYSKRLDSEHRESMELISRVWEDVRSYLHSLPADFPPAVESPAAAPPPRPKEKSEGGAGAAAEPLTTDREVATPHARTLGDRCPADDYDIERALDEALPGERKPPAAPPTPAGSQPPATPSSWQQPERGWRSVPPPAAESTRVRRPISAMRRGDDVLVVCDDGSVWMRRPTGWIEEPPIPGSDANGGEVRSEP